MEVQKAKKIRQQTREKVYFQIIDKCVREMNKLDIELGKKDNQLARVNVIGIKRGYQQMKIYCDQKVKRVSALIEELN